MKGHSSTEGNSSLENANLESNCKAAVTVSNGWTSSSVEML